MNAARERQPVFILGAARTGTTLLQRLLNSYDDVLIWGEHGGFLTDVAAGFFRAWDNPNVFKDAQPLGEVLRDSRPDETWQGWLSWSSREDWIASFRRFVDSLFVPGGLPGKRYWGFKEIRYHSSPTDRTLDFLRTLYPNALFAFIVRNPLNAIASVRRIPEGAHGLAELRRLCETWKSRYHTYRRWHAADPERSFWIVYEDLIRTDGDLHRLLGTLGKTLGEPQHAVLRSAEGRWSSFKDEEVNERWRQLPRPWLAVASASLGDLTAELGYPLPRHVASYRVAGKLLVGALRAGERLRRTLSTPLARPDTTPPAEPVASGR